MIAVLLMPFAALLIYGAVRLFVKISTGRPPVAERHAPLQARLRLIGVVVLVAGMIAATDVFVGSAPAPENGLGYNVYGSYSTTYMPGETKSSQYQNELIQGKGGALFTDAREWFESLGHGRRLAYALAVVSVVGFLVFFIAGQTLPVDSTQSEPSAEAKL
jgi:hypothetical protein